MSLLKWIKCQTMKLLMKNDHQHFLSLKNTKKEGGKKDRREGEREKGREGERERGGEGGRKINTK